MNYTYHSKQVLRVPLKPLKTSFSREELQLFFLQKEVQEALFLSSPNLFNEFVKWQNGVIIDKTEEEKLIYSLLKYAFRMHSRCTPFGLFAGCSVVKGFSDGYEILPFEEIMRSGVRNTRLDMNFTCALAQGLGELPFIKKYLKFYPNTSSYKLQDKIRYVEYYYKDKRRIHQISAVDSSIYIQKIMHAAKQGATLNELAKVIVENEISFEEALIFVTQIADEQLLVNELEPAVIGEESLSQIINKVSLLERGLKGTISIDEERELQNIVKLLQKTKNNLNEIDKTLGNDIVIYEDLAEDLKQMNIPFELSKLFQTDLYVNVQKEVKNENSSCLDFGLDNGGEFLGNTIQHQLTNAITILNQFSSQPTKTNLTEFKKKFYERYEDASVSLLEVMDTETGLGYAQNTNSTGDVNPLVNNIMLQYNNGGNTELVWNKKQSFLLKKLITAKQNNEKIIQLTAKDISEFKADWDDLPDSFSVMYQRLGKREDKDLLSIKNVGGSSATYLLGRFASSNTKIEELVTDIATTEQENNPNVIFAEISHLPESRTGNVLMRPAFRKYEIPYLSNSTLPKEQQITLDDLYLSIQFNKIILHSKRLNKQIVPRMGNAHNYSYNALPVYHFLCDLQMQNKRGGLFFDWGNLKSEFSFLPRVEIENVIVSSATWQLKKEDYNLLLKKEGVNIIKEIQKWQKKWELPNLILLVEGDNELLINLRNKLSVEMFISIIKKRANIVLKEFLFDKKTAIVKDDKGNAYTNEFIAILQKKRELLLQTEVKESYVNDKVDSLAFNSDQQVYDTMKQNVTRTFSLGSEWLYYKIYCGVKIADTILTEVIKPFTEKLIDEKLIDSWFFIRYVDPEFHLRIRFHFTELKHIGRVVSLFQEAIVEYEQNRLIWKVQTDSYQREIERYGENTILLGEQLFYYDSKCIVDMLDMIDGDEGEEIRWRFAIRAVDELLVSFNYSSEQKRDFMESLKTVFANEFNMDKNLKIQLDKKFRIHRDSISTILDKTNDKASELQPLFELLKQKSRNIIPLVTEILTIQQNNQLQLHINDLLASYIHMLLNRLFKNKQRIHEMVIYDFMWRTYHSEIAKQKHLKKQVVN